MACESFLQTAGRRVKDAGQKVVEALSYCIANAVAASPRFRSAYVDSTTLREDSHVALGLAVRTQDDSLATGVVETADTLTFRDFAEQLQLAAIKARIDDSSGRKQPHIIVSYLGATQVTSATMLVVPPALAVIFIALP